MVVQGRKESMIVEASIQRHGPGLVLVRETNVGSG